MGNITIPNHILEKIKALPWVRVSHLYEQEMIDFGYPRESVNNSEEYGSKIAEQNNVDFSWTKFLIPKGWVDVGLLFNKANPGYVIPEHSDHFKVYTDRFGHSKEKVRRRLVFLEEWKTGHYFQLGDEVFVKWKQGDYVEWGHADNHLGGNFGKNTRYTLQITGVPNE